MPISYRCCSSWRLCFRESRNPRIGPRHRPVSSQSSTAQFQNVARLEHSPRTVEFRAPRQLPVTSVAVAVPPSSPYRRFTAGTTARITTSQGASSPHERRPRSVQIQTQPAVMPESPSPVANRWFVSTENPDANGRRHRYQLLRIITSRPRLAALQTTARAAEWLPGRWTGPWAASLKLNDARFGLVGGVSEQSCALASIADRGSWSVASEHVATAAPCRAESPLEPPPRAAR